MLALILFLIAAWGWFCLVNFTDHNTPITAFVLLPILLPAHVLLECVHRAARSTRDVLEDVASASVHWENSL